MWTFKSKLEFVAFVVALSVTVPDWGAKFTPVITRYRLSRALDG